MYDIGYKYVDIKNNKGFAITINSSCKHDFIIANRLKIDKNKYRDILIKNGAIMAEDNSCIFDNEDNVIAAIVMLKLVLGG